MRTFFCLTAVGLALSAPAAHAQHPDFDSFDRRVSSLEQRVSALEAAGATKSAKQSASGAKPTYAQAFSRALVEQKPLIVWRDSAICPACVHDTADEFVSFVGAAEDTEPDAITVMLPEGQTMMKVGIIRQWVTGDRLRGHVPSIRNALARWRTNRQPTVTARGYQATSFAGYGGMGYGTPMMAMQSSGFCASCQSSGRRGR